MQQCIKILFQIYMKLNKFRATHRPSSGAQNFTSSLWFCIRGRLLDGVVTGQCQVQYEKVQSTAHHQEPKTAIAASGFAYVEGCWTCSCWTMSGTV